ncbi:MAG: NUDIX domain-containing protein, partial [Candidatus Aenigmarchaeota archaeon]|nr:NUDIX domain-containing protein [Candidatus Aenigmarchaeota archaeon]
EGETPEQASIMELSEEIRIIPKDPKIVGELKCYAGQKENIDWHVYILTSDAFDGIEAETEVAAPIWFLADKIPVNEMWEDVKYWIPLMLQNKKFVGEFYFDKEFKILLEHRLVAVD